MNTKGKYNAQKNDSRRTKDGIESDDNPYYKKEVKGNIGSTRDESERTNRALDKGGSGGG